MDCHKMDKELEQRCRHQLATEKNPLNRFTCLLLRGGCDQIRLIGKKFIAMDNSRGKKVSFDEFHLMVQQMGMKLNDEEIKILFAMFDTDESGFMEYDEFLLAVRPKMNECRQNIVRKAFDKMDKTKDSVITVHDLIGTYDHRQHPKYKNGEWTRNQVLEEFLKSFHPDIDQSGISKEEFQENVSEITLEEFMDYYSGVSASIDNDAYFCLMMTNAWKLNEKEKCEKH